MINIYNIIIIIAGILGIVFFVKEDNKKSIGALIVILATIILKQMGV